MQRDLQKLCREGIELFNRREFFECHEVLEEIWTPAVQPERWFLQSLIHFAVAFYHHERKNKAGAGRQLRKGLRKIENYLPEWGGVNTAAIASAAQRCLATIEAGGRVEQFPKIERTGRYQGRDYLREKAAIPNRIL